MTSDNGLLLKGSRIIIPKNFKDSFLHALHKEHAGITTCQLTARSPVYWPGIDEGIEDYMKHFPMGIKLCTQPAGPLINHKVPHNP